MLFPFCRRRIQLRCAFVRLQCSVLLCARAGWFGVTQAVPSTLPVVIFWACGVFLNYFCWFGFLCSKLLRGVVAITINLSVPMHDVLYSTPDSGRVFTGWASA